MHSGKYLVDNDVWSIQKFVQNLNFHESLLEPLLDFKFWETVVFSVK